MRAGHAAAAVSVALCAVAALALWNRWIEVPDDWNPWRPLDLAAQPNALTRYKLARLTGDRTLCFEILKTAPMEFEALPDRQTGPSCGLYGAVTITRTTVEVGAPFSLSCRAAVSLALWERYTLQPAAQEYLGASVARLEHFGSYACRNVYNRKDGRRSQHATAEALDLAGVVLSDGRRIRVLGDWKEGSMEGLFLHAIRDGACRFFDGVLSPDYNAAHRDHLHLDRGPYRVCR
jgi:hypothetical protein